MAAHLMAAFGWLRDRDVNAVEEMDRPGCDPARLDRTYAQFAVVNRAVSGWRRIYRAHIRPVLSATGVTTLLDIGCGGGDVPVLLAAWAAREGLRLEITAIDPDPRAFEFALRRGHVDGVTFRQASTGDLAAEGQRYDVVVSNHVLHHLEKVELPQFLAESAMLSLRTVLHNDIRRSPAAYALFYAASWPFPRSYIREDGLTSIRRSYTAAELRAAAPPGWSVTPRPPFRNLLMLNRDRPEPDRPR
ncbi:class I SAM-dependent methyltransferase [Arthrobacter oryzae]|uniref:class I SAM-dependent methyltransferase n=1 Tax=Arthrobacter oryzae TaxID=409290 RepID=UPI00273AE634|nr:class I SAM-dependent methyltransferase [Arthrobacter oryzae]WLQ06158.1 class I SAM-dependent methyltransferase [Arthrobacter oryzae]